MENLNKTKLFQKMYSNTCPHCGHDNLWSIEYECTKSKLNTDGIPIESYSTGYQVKLQCANCGCEFTNVEKVGMGFKIKSDLPPVRKIMKDFNPFQNQDYSIE